MAILRIKDGDKFVGVPAIVGPEGPGYTAGPGINISEDNVISATGGGEGGTSDYEMLANKPQINGVELVGNKTLNDLGLMSETGMQEALASKADITYVDSSLENKADKTSLDSKADKTYVDSQLADKVSVTNFNSSLENKADKTSVYTKLETNEEINKSLENKADLTYVNSQLTTKANVADVYNKEETDARINAAETTLNSKLSAKADKNDVYTKDETNNTINNQLATKADITYVDDGLTTKADRMDTYTKEEVDNILGGSSVVGDTLPIGSIIPYSGKSTPANWLLCDGREVSRTTYSELFNIISTTYGSGDGATTFNLPNLSGKVPVGVDTSDTDLDTLGKTYGEKKHKMTVDELANHLHEVIYTNNGKQINLDGGGSTYKLQYTHDGANGPGITAKAVGGSKPFNVMQPSLATNYIIKAKQSAGVVATVIDTLDNQSKVDALSANQGNILKGMIDSVVSNELKNGSRIIKFNSGLMIQTKYLTVQDFKLNNMGYANGIAQGNIDFGNWEEPFKELFWTQREINWQTVNRDIWLGTVTYTSSGMKNPSNTYAGGYRIFSPYQTSVWAGFTVTGYGTWK